MKHNRFVNIFSKLVWQLCLSTLLVIIFSLNSFAQKETDFALQILGPPLVTDIVCYKKLGRISQEEKKHYLNTK